MIFADVRLQKGDDPERLRGLGLTVRSTAEAQRRNDGPPSSARRAALPSPKFRQPCAALDGCRCRIYAERPCYCREFECALLKSVNAGRTRREAALGTIRAARQRAATVVGLLRQLGEDNEQLNLAARFRLTARRLEKQELDEEKAELYGRLTLVVHDLNLALARAFYPGAGADKPVAETQEGR